MNFIVVANCFFYCEGGEMWICLLYGSCQLIKRLYLVGVSTSIMILLDFTVTWSMKYDLNMNLFNSLSLIG